MSGIDFPSTLLAGTLVRRFNRFLAEVDLSDGGRIVAHCPNSGSMLSVCDPGSPVWVSRSDSATRKLPYTWEVIQVGDTLVGINTGWPNRIVAGGITAGAIPELAGYASLRREVKYGARSRIDMMLEDDARPPCLIEVKNVTMRRLGSADAPCEFPDAVTARGTKHLEDLADAAKRGMRAVIFFLVQRGDGFRLRIARDIDPGYDAALRRATAAGVEVLAYRCRVSLSGVRLADAAEFLSIDAPVT